MISNQLFDKWTTLCYPALCISQCILTGFRIPGLASRSHWTPSPFLTSLPPYIRISLSLSPYPTIFLPTPTPSPLWNHIVSKTVGGGGGPDVSHPPSISPLAATLMGLLASVANKRLTTCLSPLDATLTKNRGVHLSS